MKPEVMTDEEYKAHKLTQYTEDVINRAEICQATGELQFPMCLLPLPLRVVAIIVQDKVYEQQKANKHRRLI